MNARQRPSSAPGPDLLARYLNAYLQARQMSDMERPWGLGDDSLDTLWSRLTEAITDPPKLNKIVSDELTDADRWRIVETLAPLIFALPLRSYPAELRATKSGPRLMLNLRHTESTNPEHVGYLPAALTTTFAAYLRRVMRWPEERHRYDVTISSGGRRRRVRVTMLAHERGVIIRFLERLPSPAEQY